MPAGLVKILLLMAGIERNPGPIYICPVCFVRVRENAQSVICNKCQKWVHLRKQNNCSELKSFKDYNKSYICSSCSFDPLPDPPSPPSPPSPTSPPSINPAQHRQDNNNTYYDLNILQWNCNGIRTKTAELTDFIKEHQIKVACLQETKLGEKSTSPNIPNFTLVRKDRSTNNGGGLATYIHKSILFSRLPDIPSDGHTESLGVKIGDTNINNIYIPPTTSCSNGFKPDIQPLLLPGDSLILGDFNAHDLLWHSNIQDNRGSELADEIGNSPFGVLNENTPTRVPSNGSATSPDISIASTSLINSVEWRTETSLGSDHLPIIIKISTTIQPIKNDFRKFVNFNKANWNKFNTITESDFSKLNEPTNVHNAEKEFRKIINKASKKCVPGGRIKEIIPEIPTATANKIKTRDAIRINNPNSPEIAILNRDILKEINQHRKSKWREKVTDIKCSTKLYKLIKNLNGKKSNSNNNQAIKFKGKYLTSSLDIADGFNKQYTSVVRHQSSKNSRVISKSIKKNELDENISFTPEQTWKAIKASKASKAAGPDNITNLHLKHLGPIGVSYLTKIFNLSMTTSDIPDIWKKSVIIPLLKPNKPSDESDSFRPVSLLCPAIKILERLLLPSLTENLNIPVFQHGFRKDHSTVTALNDFNEQVTNGFNKKLSAKPDRTVLLQIDLSKAFDMVNHDKLLKDLNGSTLPPTLKRWFCGYLKGRKSQVNFRNTSSKFRNVRAGVPQGAVTSPILFNFYLRNLPHPPENIQVVQYADDISIYATGNPIPRLAETINKYIPAVLNFLEERELKVSPTKSTVTLFTTDTKEFNIKPSIYMNNVEVPHEQTPKLLGVTFDTMYCYAKHVKNVTDTAKSRVNMMKSLAGSTWGQDQETLSTTYKSICRSVLEYAAPIWTPVISDTSWDKLQSVQNQALRIITGNLKMSSEPHLHRESKILPIKDHCEMISKQFLLSNFVSNHPNHKHTSKPLPPRKIKPSIQTYRPNIISHLPVTKDNLKRKTKEIHTKEVKTILSKYPPNKVLQRNPPEINIEEKRLPRATRTQLSQLRSGYSRLLKSYLHRINESTDDKCPNCKIHTHTTNHLFNCPQNRTNLTVLSLWTQPIQAANFLNLDTGIT